MTPIYIAVSDIYSNIFNFSQKYQSLYDAYQRGSIEGYRISIKKSQWMRLRFTSIVIIIHAQTHSYMVTAFEV